MKTLSVFSIVKNEEAMIEGMFQSAAGAYEHIVVDTGSSDRTIEIARKYTDKIYTDFTWNDSFSDAKNHALAKCTGDYVIGLDADCRFKHGALAALQAFIQTADKDVYRVPLIWNDPNKKMHHWKIYRWLPALFRPKDKIHHWLPKLFRRESGLRYVGNVHEYPSILPQGNVNAPIVFLYSPNHYKDPDRNLRCLLKDDTNKPRNQFYLGREYYERKKYLEAIAWLEKYIQSNSWAAEKAEGFLTLARCYWFTHQGDKARQACGKAILINPDFKEALLLMSAMHYEPNKTKWKKLADISTNTDVLFIRT